MRQIVTRDSLIAMLKNSNRAYVEAVIGRALVGIYDRQTDSEKVTNDTHNLNYVGFTGADAHSGCLTAKYYLKHKRLLDWQIEMWTKPNKNGVPRIAKYWKQLNEIAMEKAA